MATFNYDRKNTLMHKREVRMFAAELDIVKLGFADGDTYRLANLPEKAIIVSTMTMVNEVSDSTVSTANIGTTPSGANLLSGADLEVLGATVSSADPIDTGAGLPLYITPTFTTPPTTGKVVLMVEYVEYTLKAEEYTEITNV